MNKRILFLMSDTGGGHRAAAQAIAEALHLLFPGQYDTVIEDVWKHHTPWPISKLPGAYPWLAGPGRPLWKRIWSETARFQAHRLIFWLLQPLIKRTVIRYFSTIQPDLVVSVHPLMNHLGLKLINEAELTVPFVTVVTDMVAVHPTWICPGVTRCLVSTDLARAAAIRLGMPPEKLKVCGQPVGLRFATMAGDRFTCRQKLGLAVRRPTLLLMGGGEGRGPVFAIARSLAQGVPQAQLLIVTGRNKRLKAKLEGIRWEIPTWVYGFVENMPELMGAADMLLTKAGPGTLSEAFIAGLPVIIYGYIPGQEKGNVGYVQQHRAGAFADTPQKITRLVLNWLDPAENSLEQMARNARALARPDASWAIAEELCGLLRETITAQPDPKPWADRGRILLPGRSGNRRW